MDSMIAFCGLDCGSCPIRLATLETDAGKKLAMRVDVAKTLKEIYKSEISAQAITDCDGCKAAGRLFNGCAGCPIRLCAAERKLKSCAHCEDYGCEKLERHLAIDPAARKRLEEIRNGSSTGEE
jgi:hypothetical protein